MPETLVLQRELPLPPNRLFDCLTQQHQMLRWWGREGMTIPEHGLNFSREGPWHSVMQVLGASRKMVSGRVIKVDRPYHLAFTWGWHEGGPAGPRGPESHVDITINETHPGLARLVLTHSGLVDSTDSEGHRVGWDSILDNLERSLS